MNITASTARQKGSFAYHKGGTYDLLLTQGASDQFLAHVYAYEHLGSHTVIADLEKSHWQAGWNQKAGAYSLIGQNAQGTNTFVLGTDRLGDNTYVSGLIKGNTIYSVFGPQWSHIIVNDSQYMQKFYVAVAGSGDHRQFWMQNSKYNFNGTYNAGSFTGSLYANYNPVKLGEITYNDPDHSFGLTVKDKNNFVQTQANGYFRNKNIALHVLSDNHTFDFSQSAVNNGVAGSLNLNTGNFLAAINYTRLNGLVNARGNIDGLLVNYREIIPTVDGINRELMITKKNGQNIFLDNTDIEAVMKGDVNHILDVVEYDFQASLDFNHHWGGSNFVSFDTHQRLLSGNVDGNSAALKLGKTGYLQFDAADNNIHLKVSAPAKGTLYLERANFRNDSFALNLDNTTLNYNDATQIAGLYTSSNYLVKIQTGGTDQMTDDLKDAFNLGIHGDFDKAQRDRMIKNNIKEVRINFREVARGNRLHFTDQRWNSLMTTLAWDVPSAAFTGDDIIKIIDAPDSKEQTYIALSALLNQNLSRSLVRKEKSLSFKLGESLMSSSKGVAEASLTTLQAPKALGITGLNQGTVVNFDQTSPTMFGSNGRIGAGVEEGTIDINVPLVGESSRSALGLSAYAQRFYASFGDQVIDTSDISLGLNSMVYVYRFPDPLTLSVRDSYHQGFSLNHFNSHAYEFDVTSMSEQFGTAIPGMMLSADLKSPDNGWYTSAKVMPYVPLNLTESLQVAPAGLAYGTDVHAGVNTKVFNKGLSVDVCKDVNDYLTFAPTMTFNDAWDIGVETAGPDFSQRETMKYKTGLKTGPVTSHLFMEQNYLSQTDVVGTSIDAKVGKNLYNISMGVSRWDNNGQREIVDRYVALGTDLNKKTRLMTSVTVNDVAQTVNYTTSSQFNIGSRGDKRLAMETSMTRGAHEVGYDLRLKGQFLF